MYLFDGHHCPKCHGLTYEGYEALGLDDEDYQESESCHSEQGTEFALCSCNKELYLVEPHSRTYKSYCYTGTGVMCLGWDELVSGTSRYSSYSYHCVLDEQGRPMPGVSPEYARWAG